MFNYYAFKFLSLEYITTSVVIINDKTMNTYLDSSWSSSSSSESKNASSSSVSTEVSVLIRRFCWTALDFGITMSLWKRKKEKKKENHQVETARVWSGFRPHRFLHEFERSMCFFRQIVTIQNPWSRKSRIIRSLKHRN